MGQTKIGVFADTHVGRCVPMAIGELRRRAYRHAFTEAINIFIEEGVDRVIHAGDLFERRSMTPEDSVFVKEELQRLVNSVKDRYDKDILIFAVRGNHDGVPESNALDYIKHPLARYLRTIGDDLSGEVSEAQVNEDLFLLAVGYHTYISRRFQDLKPIIKKGFAGKSGLKILVVHNFVGGYHQIPLGVPEHNVLTIRDFSDLGADIVIAGHYHTRMEPAEEGGTTLLTPGATEAVDLSDKGPYGVYILEGERSVRFVKIKPLHEIMNIKVDSEQAVRPAKWFIEKALEGIGSYATGLQKRGVEGILRLVLLGLTDEEPHDIEQLIMQGIAEARESIPQLLHVDLVNRVENIKQPVALPILGGGIEFSAEILQPFGDLTQEAMKIVEEVSMVLEERASQRTGLLTDSDRAPFVTRWLNLIERMEGQA